MRGYGRFLRVIASPARRKKPLFCLSRPQRTRLWPTLWLLLTLFSPHRGLADFFTHHWENHFQDEHQTSFRLEGKRALSTANFDASGNPALPTGFASYARTLAELTVRTGLTQQLSVWGRLSWTAQSFLSQTSATGPPTQSFGLGDQSFGIHFRLVNTLLSPKSSLSQTQTHPLTLDLALQADFPAYQNPYPSSGTFFPGTSSNATPPLLQGDQSVDVTFGGFASWGFYQTLEGKWTLSLGSGVTRRSLGYSAAIPSSLILAYQPQFQGFSLQVLAFSLLSLKTDPRTVLPQPSQNAGSFFTGAINPSLLQAALQLGYQLTPQLEFFARVSETFWGQDVPSGWMLGGGVLLRLGPKTLPPESALNPYHYGKPNQGFVNYSLEAKIIATNDRLSLVKLNKGSQDGIEVGQFFDLFAGNTTEQSEKSVARGEVVAVRATTTVIKITEYFESTPLEADFVARRLVAH